MARRSKAKSKRWVVPPEPVRIWLPSSPLLDNTDSQKVSNCIAKEIHQFFQHLTTSSASGGGGATAARPGIGQWTVVAGFVALEEDSQDPADGNLSRAGSEGGTQHRLLSTSPYMMHNSPRTLNDLSRESESPVSVYEPSHASGTGTAATSHGKYGKWVNVKICSIASGVKCLGPSPANVQTPSDPSERSPNDTVSGSNSPCTWTERESVVVDMHAEILARRELECLLMREMRVLLKRERLKHSCAEQEVGSGVADKLNGGQEHRNSSTNGPTIEQEGEEEADIEPILLELASPPWSQHPSSASTSAQPPSIPRLNEMTRSCFRLKSSVQLYLYTSHAPCGAASDAAHIRRLDAEDQSIYQLLSRFNTIDLTIEASSLHGQAEETDVQPISSFRQSKSLRVPPICKKPSRADAPPTTAFSCTDKLGRYQWLGFQGGRLSKMFESAEPVQLENHRERHNPQAYDEQSYVGYPIRLYGLVVGEDYESTCLRKIFGNAAGSDTDEATYSRIRDGVPEVLAHCGKTSGRQWLSGLTMKDDCRISKSSLIFPYGRAVTSESSESFAMPTVPADADISKLRTLPLPLLRDILLPASALSSTPFSVALSYHAFSIPQALGPNGRLSGVIRDKRTKHWGDNSVARVARGRMWDAYQRLVEDHEECFGKLEDGGIVRLKGGKGWREAAQWMEERGPYAGWHSPRTSVIEGGIE
ncbi:hypothetical protein QFC24_004979 [Naganishia onofrii]|uniref:Uncharacterized protein n=1 Tax=Naganishia onofrii TaxID=1851511 RepID=A0ACC2XAF2_9TREE|nr:hypothetical protein QFC24_004979 [Naganishia onofrii]